MLGGVGPDAPAVWLAAELQGIPSKGRQISIGDREGRADPTPVIVGKGMRRGWRRVR